MPQKGWLGQKNGIGFYRYRGRKKRFNEWAENSLRAARSEAGAFKVVKSLGHIDPKECEVGRD